MALSGSKSVAVTSYDTLKFSWSASQNVSGNYSTVKWKLTLSSTAYGRINSTASKDWAVTIAGERFTGTNTVGIGASSNKTLASGSLRVDHDSDGTKSFNYTFSQEFAITFSGNYIGTKTGSGSATLDTIPRASSLTVPTITLGSSGTLTINRASSSFTHTVTAKFGSYSTTIASKTSATSLTFSPPASWADAIPNATSGKCTYTIDTYNGSTKIGTKTTTGTLKITDSDPFIDGFTLSDGVTDTKNKIGAFVQSKSKLNAVIRATGQNGATISKYELIFEGVTYSGSTVTTDYIQGSGTIGYTIKVTDSRGASMSQEGTISVLAYKPPKISLFSAKRCEAGGVVADDGTRALISRDWTITSLNSKNDNTWDIDYRQAGTEEWLTCANGTGYSVTSDYITQEYFNADLPYEIRVVLKDYWTETKKIIEIGTAFTLVDYNASGKSLSFGGVSTRSENEKAMDIFLDMYDEYGTPIQNGIADFMGLSGSRNDDADTTMKKIVVTDVNTPDSLLSFVFTIYYLHKTATAVRKQIAIPYSDNSHTPYMRQFFSGAWTAWTPITGDTGWIDAELTSTFSHASTTKLQYRRTGKTVALFGTVSVASSFTSSPSRVTICTLPEGFRPSKRAIVVCAGASTDTWMLIVDTDGVVSCSRYASGGSYVNPNTSVSLHITTTFLID